MPQSRRRDLMAAGSKRFRQTLQVNGETGDVRAIIGQYEERFHTTRADAKKMDAQSYLIATRALLLVIACQVMLTNTS